MWSTGVKHCSRLCWAHTCNPIIWEAVNLKPVLGTERTHFDGDDEEEEGEEGEEEDNDDDILCCKVSMIDDPRHKYITGNQIRCNC